MSVKDFLISGSSATTHNGITTKWIYLTPELAKQFLLSNRKNRRFMQTLSARYGTDMTLGQWQETHEGIAFDEKGAFIDGQHRCEAVISSGVSIWILVTSGLKESVIEVINRGKVRTIAHALQIMGYEVADQRTIATARRMVLGPTMYSGYMMANNSGWLSDTSMRKFIDMNMEAIVFTAANFRKKAGPASVAAAIARAYYHADTERLARFGSAMLDQIPKDDLLPGDQSARSLRRVIDAQAHNSGLGSVILFRKAQNALYAYLNNTDLSKLYESDEDIFPLPLDRKLPEC